MHSVGQERLRGRGGGVARGGVHLPVLLLNDAECWTGWGHVVWRCVVPEGEGVFRVGVPDILVIGTSHRHVVFL